MKPRKAASSAFCRNCPSLKKRFGRYNCEEALKAAKNGARGNSSGRWFGREKESGCFCVYDGGKVVERHISIITTGQENNHPEGWL